MSLRSPCLLVKAPNSPYKVPPRACGYIRTTENKTGALQPLFSPHPLELVVYLRGTTCTRQFSPDTFEYNEMLVQGLLNRFKGRRPPPRKTKTFINMSISVNRTLNETSVGVRVVIPLTIKLVPVFGQIKREVAELTQRSAPPLALSLLSLSKLQSDELILRIAIAT